MKRLERQGHLNPLRRWWWLILISTLLVTVGSYFYMVRQPAVYTSQSTLIVGATLQPNSPEEQDLSLPPLLAETYADIAMRGTVRQAIMDALGMAQLPVYSVQALPSSPVIEVTVTAERPEIAYAVANELVRQLIQQGSSGSEKPGGAQFMADRLAVLESDINSVKEEIEINRGKLTEPFSAQEIAAAQDEIVALQEALNSLQSTYIDLLDRTLSGTPNAVSVIEEANLPTLSEGSNLLLTLLLAAVAGFLLGAAGAYLLEYLDDTVKTSDDVKSHLGLSTLTAIPAIEQSKTTVFSGKVAVSESKLVMMTTPDSAAAESFRILRTNLKFADENGPSKFYLFTSPEPGDGKSTTIANFGIALAHAGRQVIILDADLHRPTQHRLFQLPNSQGLTNALFHQVPHIGPLLQKTSVPSLRVLTTGPLPPNPSELLGSERMTELLNQLDTEADIVLIDTPPATVLIDAATLSRSVDAVVLVLRAGKTAKKRAKQALDALQLVRARVAGVVLNGVSVKNTGYHYNYKEYGYNRYGHTAPTGTPPASKMLPGYNPAMPGRNSQGTPNREPYRRMQGPGSGSNPVNRVRNHPVGSITPPESNARQGNTRDDQGQYGYVSRQPNGQPIPFPRQLHHSEISQRAQPPTFIPFPSPPGGQSKPQRRLSKWFRAGK